MSVLKVSDTGSNRHGGCFQHIPTEASSFPLLKPGHIRQIHMLLYLDTSYAEKIPCFKDKREKKAKQNLCKQKLVRKESLDGVLAHWWSPEAFVLQSFGLLTAEPLTNSRQAESSVLEGSPSDSSCSFINFIHSVSRFWVEIQTYWPFSSLCSTSIPKCSLSIKVIGWQ